MNAHALSLDSFDHDEVVDQTSPPVSALGAIMIDGLLAIRLRRGDEYAFNEFVAQNHGALIKMAMRHVGDRDTAAEVAQDTWVALLEGIHRFEGRSSLRTWLFSILLHKAKDRGVRESKHVTFSALEAQGESESESVDPSRVYSSRKRAGCTTLPPQPWYELSPDRLLASKQAFDALNEAVEALPPTLRAVLTLKEVDGLASSEICDRLQISEANLYVRLHRARERVRHAVNAAINECRKRAARSGSVAALVSTAPVNARTLRQISEIPAEVPVKMDVQTGTRCHFIKRDLCLL